MFKTIIMITGNNYGADMSHHKIKNNVLYLTFEVIYLLFAKFVPRKI